MARTRTAEPEQAEQAPEQALEQATEQAEQGEQNGQPTGLDEDFIASGAYTLAADLADVAAPQRVRPAKQQAMDKVIAAIHARWGQVGRPTTWAKLMETHVVKSYFVQPDQAGEIKRYIGSAAKLHGVRIKYGSEFIVSEALITKHNLPADYLGRTVISFAVMDKRPHSKTGASGSVNGDVNGDVNGGNEG
jgi:hypothetical protein